ncbi:hypothetical protein [Roseibacillus ishigakijimensis]|uniref:Thrombospondin type 3 repeat-containing protein n=1 Tax=Roseibacillus ishigakijimensis TaxID=454146 RepID=A0A934RRS0_9BACT|nr:hypothetical protein [Roseibacillus ishigakijimensis]MBK1834446.1 hypothetical protein [Roseibacillus ishigakijimensis]
MTKNTFLILGLATSAWGELKFYEPFDYPEGSLAGQINNGFAWTLQAGGTTDNAVGTSSLVVNEPEGFLSAGGRAVQSTASARAFLPLGSEVAPGVEGTTIYVSFLHKLNFIDIPRSQILEFWRGSQADNNTVFSFGVDTNPAAPDYGLLVDKNAATAVAVETGEASDSERLVVFRLDFGADDQDTISVYLDPGAVEPEVSSGSVTYQDLSFDLLGFGSFQGSSHEVDEIRIGTSYLDVVPVFVDSDNDGMNDAWEDTYGLLVGEDDAGADFDADGLENLEEYLAGTNPADSDSDDDGLSDGEEASPVNNLNPYQNDVLGSAPGDLTNPLSADSDNDGIPDGEEIVAGEDGFVTNPNWEDTDDDELPDAWEIAEGLDPTSDSGPFGDTGDPDNDGLDNFEEFSIGTRPQDPDTDKDGYSDGAEDNYGAWGSVNETGSNPLLPDTDGDGLLDGEENPDTGSSASAPYRSDPTEFDSDEDGYGDGVEVSYGSDPDDANSVPVVEPVVAAVQFDVETSVGNTLKYAGSYAPAAGEGQTPAHALAWLGAEEVVFNSLHGDSGKTLVSTTGEPLPGLEIDFGTLMDGAFDFDDEPEESGDGAPDGSNLYETALMSDWLFTRGDKNLVARVKGLAAGSYRVVALVREGSQPGRTYDVAFGTQPGDGSSEPLLGPAQVGIAGAPAEWTEGQNYFSEIVTLSDDEFVVVNVDPTNAAFGTLQGLQIIPVVDRPEATIDIVRAEVIPPDTFELSFQALAHQEYVLQSSVSLLDGFETLPEVRVTTDGEGWGLFSLTVNLAARPKQFFRISEE